jgi:hypothetical protein
MNPIKPGWKTTEFWLTLVTQIVSILAVLGLVSFGDAKELGDAITKAVGAVFVLVTNGAILWKYIQSRLSTKSNEVEIEKLQLQLQVKEQELQVEKLKYEA